MTNEQSAATFERLRDGYLARTVKRSHPDVWEVATVPYMQLRDGILHRIAAEAFHATDLEIDFEVES